MSGIIDGIRQVVTKKQHSRITRHQENKIWKGLLHQREISVVARLSMKKHQVEYYRMKTTALPVFSLCSNAELFDFTLDGREGFSSNAEVK